MDMHTNRIQEAARLAMGAYDMGAASEHAPSLRWSSRLGWSVALAYVGLCALAVLVLALG